MEEGMSEITIEEVKKYLHGMLAHAGELKAEGLYMDELDIKRISTFRLAISQSETIKAQGEEIAKVRQELDEAYERAAQVCELEAVDAESTGAEEDKVYNLAIKHCSDSIRALKSESTDEVKR